MAPVRPALLLYLTILLATLSGLAASSNAVPDRLAEALRDLPVHQLETGILLDRVIPLSRIGAVDGGPGAPRVTTREWKEMYAEVARASAPSASPLPELNALIQRGGRPAAGQVRIVWANVLYDRIRPDAVQDGTLRVADGRLEPAGPGNPFELRRLFAAAAVRQDCYRGDGVVFLLDRGDYVTNERDLPGRIEADFDDGGGFVPVSFGVGQTVHYLSTGEKTVRLRAVFPDGTALVAAFAVDVRSLRTPAPQDTLHITATIPYGGALGTGDAYVYLSDRHTSLTDPVLVFEGFDPENTMNWDELYALLNRENLIETLRSLGFDAVVLNFTNGGDYIQRNAFVGVELIRRVREATGPDRTMALVGPSMGGLVARYALSYMEQQGIPHSVRTWISFDSPHSGANIPLGMQYWLWFFADQSADAAAFLADLDTPAARQMLVYHHTDPPGGSGQADPLRADFVNDLAAVGGYPAIPRKVAVANGSGNRLFQGFPPGAQIIQWEYSSFVVSITGDCWAVPSGSAQTVFHGLIEYFYIPWDEAVVTVSGTRPYDGAPGGWKDSMALLGAVDPGYGDIIAPYPNHCFIPTISSLALYTTDLFYDIAGDPDILQHTPFDAVYFPSSNQEHVEINSQNVPWFIGEIVQGANDVVSGSALPGGLARLDAPSPNPSEQGALIRFRVPWAGPVRITIHDVSGRKIADLPARQVEAGPCGIEWNGRSDAGRTAAPGVYLVRVQGRGFAASGKIAVSGS